MADTITEPAVPSTPAKPDVLPFVEPAAASEAKEPNIENDTLENETRPATSVPAPAPVSEGAHGADSSVAPASSATDISGGVPALATKEEGSNKVPATVEAAQEREGTPSADTKGIA
ncbi:hypothetical protein SEPCBS57363_002018 [Sporothrix epigloea]|uniref:Uncharacterized protein n=1 Tax=Sporothrix epigloea TaxID=1892477 RepID=A0ABP0DDH6_9PEZI